MSATLYVGENAYFLEYTISAETDDAEGSAPEAPDLGALAGPGYAGGLTGMPPGLQARQVPQASEVVTLITERPSLLESLRSVLGDLDPGDEPDPAPYMRAGSVGGNTLPLDKCQRKFTFYRISSGGFVVKYVKPIRREDVEAAVASQESPIFREIAEGVMAGMDRTLPGPARIFGFMTEDEVVQFVENALGAFA